MAVACLAVAGIMTWGCGSGTGTKARLPSGVVDTPQPNQNISGRFAAFGWAISEDGIKQVSVYVDRVFLMNCTYGTMRPDVNQAIPGFPQGDRAGWTADIDATSLPEGKHEMVFQAESNKGATRDIGAIPVIVAH
ncbi:MAG: hypothetical protein ABSH40_15445 [Bryobacteraceae bacterium]